MTGKSFTLLLVKDATGQSTLRTRDPLLQLANPLTCVADRIIKVWDRNTLSLQASLHGHFDFITDIDISKCNRFIASAGKDAQAIIWDLRTGRIVKRLANHTSLINRIVFVAPRVPSAGPPSQAHPEGQTNS